MDQWYVATPGGKTEGPHSTEELVIKIRRGQVARDAQVCNASGSIWLSMHDVPEFERALRRAPTIVKMPGEGVDVPPLSQPKVREPGDDTIRPPGQSQPREVAPPVPSRPKQAQSSVPAPAAVPVSAPAPAPAPTTPSIPARSQPSSAPAGSFFAWLVSAAGAFVVLVGGVYSVAGGGDRALAVMILGLTVTVLGGQVQPGR